MLASVSVNAELSIHCPLQVSRCRVSESNVAVRGLGKHGGCLPPIRQQQQHGRSRGLAVRALKLSLTGGQTPADVPVADVSNVMSSLGMQAIPAEDLKDAEQLAATKSQLAKALENLSTQEAEKWQDPSQLADLIIACEALGLAWDHLLVEPESTLSGKGLAQLSSRQLAQLALACCERCAESRFTASVVAFISSPQCPAFPTPAALAILDALLRHHKRLPRDVAVPLARKGVRCLKAGMQQRSADEVALVLAVLGRFGVKRLDKGVLWEVADRFVGTLPQADVRSVIRGLVGFARMGWQPPMLVQQVVSHLNSNPSHWQRCSSPDLVHLLWALAQLKATGASTLALIKTVSILLIISHTASELTSGRGRAAVSPGTQGAAVPPSSLAAVPVLPNTPTPSTFGAFQAAALQLASNIMNAASAMTKPNPLGTAVPSTSQQAATNNASVSTETIAPSGASAIRPVESTAPDSLLSKADVSDGVVIGKGATRRPLTAQELSVVAWACVRCGYTNKTLLSQLLRLLMVASPAAAAPVARLPPVVVSQAVWACGQLRYWQAGLEEWVEAHLMERLADGSVGTQNVAVACWAMAVCGKRPSPHFTAAVLESSEQRMMEFQAREMSALFWALSTWDCQLPSSFQEAANTALAARVGSFPVWDLCSVVMSLDRLVPFIPHSLLSSLEQQLLLSLHPLHYRPLSWYLLACQRKGFQPRSLVPQLCTAASQFLTLVCIAELDELEPRLKQESRRLGLQAAVDVRSWPLHVAALVFGLGCHASWVMKEGGEVLLGVRGVVAKAEQELLRRPSLLPAETLASVLWAMSEVHHVPKAWLQCGLHRTLHQAVPHMSFKDLSLTLLALSKWHQHRHMGQAQAAYVQAPAINRLHMLLQRSHLASPSSSPSTRTGDVRVTASLGRLAAPSLGGLSGSSLVREELKPHMVVDVATALSHLPCYSSRLVNSIANMALSRLDVFNGRTLTALLSALATLRHDEPRLLRAVSQVYPTHTNWRPANLSAVQRLLSAYAKLNHQPGEYVLQAAADAVANLQICGRLQMLADSVRTNVVHARGRSGHGTLVSSSSEFEREGSEEDDAFREEDWEVVLPSYTQGRTDEREDGVLFTSASTNGTRDTVLEKMTGSSTGINYSEVDVSSDFYVQQDQERVMRSLQSDTSTSNSSAANGNGWNNRRANRVGRSEEDVDFFVSTAAIERLEQQGTAEDSQLPVGVMDMSTASTRIQNGVASVNEINGAGGERVESRNSIRNSGLRAATIKEVEVVCTIMYYLALMKQHTGQLSIQLSTPLISVLEADGQVLGGCGRWVGACLALAEADGSESPFSRLSADARETCMTLWRAHARRQSKPKQVYPMLRDVCKVLQTLGLETQASCLTSDGTTFMDISFSFTGRQMALELLLPGKNCSRNTLRLSGEGSLRRRLLQARGYHVIYLNRKTWSDMGSNWEAKLRFVRKLLVEVPGRKHLGAFDEVHITERVQSGDGVGGVVSGRNDEVGVREEAAVAERELLGQQKQADDAPVLRQPPSIGESRIPALRSLASRRRPLQKRQGVRPAGVGADGSSADFLMPEASALQSVLSVGM